MLKVFHSFAGDLSSFEYFPLLLFSECECVAAEGVEQDRDFLSFDFLPLIVSEKLIFLSESE